MKEEKKRMAVEAMGLPKDVLLGDVLVRFTGFHEVCIENYRSILIYTDTTGKTCRQKTARILDSRKRLRIDYYTAEEMKITGQITSLEFET